MSHQLIVAIGRESGSGGLDIAHALAERLQLPLFDKSILQKAAEDKGVSAETLERYDERPYSPLFCRSVRGISSAPEDCVAQMQFELLRQHANAGESFVVLGRCAEEVLADREGLISIFVRADLDLRVKRTPLPEEEALDFITLPSGDLLHGTSVNYEIVDNVLHFFVNYNLPMIRPAEETYMETLETEVGTIGGD